MKFIDYIGKTPLETVKPAYPDTYLERIGFKPIPTEGGTPAYATKKKVAFILNSGHIHIHTRLA